MGTSLHRQAEIQPVSQAVRSSSGKLRRRKTRTEGKTCVLIRAVCPWCLFPVGVMHRKPKPTTQPLLGAKCRRRTGQPLMVSPWVCRTAISNTAWSVAIQTNHEQHPPTTYRGGQAFVGIVQQTVFHTVGISAYPNHIKGVMNYEKSVRLRKVWQDLYRL